MKPKGINLLVNALTSEDYALADNLLKLESNPNLSCPTLSMTALEWAAQEHKFDWLEKLIKYKGDLNNSFIPNILFHKFEFQYYPQMKTSLDFFKNHIDKFPDLFSQLKEDQMVKIFETLLRMNHAKSGTKETGYMAIEKIEKDKIILDYSIVHDYMELFLIGGRKTFDTSLVREKRDSDYFNREPQPQILFLPIAQSIIDVINPNIMDAPYEIDGKKLIIHVSPKKREELQRKNSTNEVWFIFQYNAVYALHKLHEFGYLNKFTESFENLNRKEPLENKKFKDFIEHMILKIETHNSQKIKAKIL